jgi:hypothetical protein
VKRHNQYKTLAGKAGGKGSSKFVSMYEERVGVHPLLNKVILSALTQKL